MNREVIQHANREKFGLYFVRFTLCVDYLRPEKLRHLRGGNVCCRFPFGKPPEELIDQVELWRRRLLAQIVYAICSDPKPLHDRSPVARPTCEEAAKLLFFSKASECRP